MTADNYFIFDFISTLEKISSKIQSELESLKKRVNFLDIARGLEDKYYKFYTFYLKPNLEVNHKYSIEEIQDLIEKKGKKKYTINTIRSYLSKLSLFKLIERDNMKDGRKKLYILSSD